MIWLLNLVEALMYVRRTRRLVALRHRIQLMRDDHYETI